MNTPEISRLFYYPIKSFRGVESKTLNLQKQGPEFDRQWMLVDEDNQFITQRQIPTLARIGVSIVDEARIELSLKGELVADFGLMEKESETIHVKVWKDEVAAHEVSSDVSAAISKLLD